MGWPGRWLPPNRCEAYTHSNRMHQEFDTAIVTQTVGSDTTPDDYKEQQGGSQIFPEEPAS